MEWLSPLLTVAAEALKLVNAKFAKQWLNEFTQVCLAIQEEESKGDLSDDAKIEALYAKRAILAKAAEAEIRSGSGSVSK